MASYLPKLRPSTPEPDRDPGVYSLEDDAVDDLLETLSSKTRRTILLSLYESPATPAELADVVGSSLQNVHYHLERRQAADLVEAIDHRYSEKGTEMAVYAPTNDPLIVVEGQETQSWVRAMLPSFLGAVGLVGGVSLLVQWLADSLASPTHQSAEALTLTADTGASAAPTVQDQVTTLLLEPGMLVFVGGVLAIATVLLVGLAANR
ncbi:MAG: ArsR/SmtB family transcription factor [Halanaeroarchaeum sp.]